MSQIQRVKSYKYFQNEEIGTDEKEQGKRQTNYFTCSNERRNFQQGKLQSSAKKSLSKSKQKMYSSFLNDSKLSKYFQKTTTPDKRSSIGAKDSKQKSYTKQLRSLLKDKYDPNTPLKYEEKKQRNFTSKVNEFGKDSKNQLKQTKNSSSKNNQDYLRQTSTNLSLNRLRNSVRHIKTLQQQKQNIQSRSRSRTQSSKKKGLICTLYQKSQQKKINESNIKSNKKLITIKTKYEKTEGELGQEKSVPQSDIKRIILKRKNKEDKLNTTTCFDSIVINRSRSKSKSRPPKPYHQTLSRLNQTCQLLKKQKPQSTQKHKSNSKNKSLNKSYNSISSRPLLKTFQTSQKKFQSSISKSNIFPSSFITPSKPATKKITLNQRIQSNLDKIHQKYKFILNYMTDFDIISRLNGYELAKEQQCKWILLIIDQVYEMIKHAQETKLKGLNHSRNYQYKHNYVYGKQQQQKE